LNKLFDLMLSTPKKEYREKRFYLSISKTVHIQEVPKILPPLIPEVRGWFKAHGIQPVGPEFFLFKSINQDNLLDSEVGLGTAENLTGDEEIHAGYFPAGTYASIIHTGHFDGLMEAHKALEEWILENNLREKVTTSKNVTHWGGRIEFYLVDPDDEPDSSKWKTEVVFLLEDVPE